MNLHRAWLAPWVATPRSSRWLFVVVLAVVALGDVVGRILGLPRHGLAFSAAMLALANVACWLLLMPNGLLLALAARRLRLPGISRDVAWSLPLYAALWIGVPMLCQFPQGHVLGFAVVQVLVAAGAMLFMVMPNYLGLTLYFIFLISHRALSHVISIPGPFDPRFLPWGGTLAVVLVLALAWRWWQLLDGACSERGWRAPTLINLRRNMGASQSDPLTDANGMRARPNWLLARPDLRGVGPQSPDKSLRMALGGVYLPQTAIGLLCQWIPAVLVLLMMGMIFFFITLDDDGLANALHYAFSREGFRMVSWMFGIFSLLIVMMPVELLTLRWRRMNAELPLLALLPGFGAAEHGRQVLLRTAIRQPAMRLGVLLLVGWLGAITLHAGWPVVLAMLMVVSGCLGYLVATTMNIFGGLPPTAFSKGLLMIGMVVLLTLSVLVPQLHDVLAAWAVAGADDALMAAWLVLVSWLLWFGHRGWRGLRQRPHPFMPN
ncbi:MAG TPA: hypothetical protein VN043_13095 [Rhodanobacter sp.]|nr:hypothetical protein [Rhodanobacter sp.]